MGCAPSSDHRHIGLRREPFRNSVFPGKSIRACKLIKLRPYTSNISVPPGVRGDDNVWAAPVFENGFRHRVDLSAFLSQSSVPPEDPPPYSEQLLEGHITLMKGSKPQAHKDDVSEDQDPNNSTLLTTGDVSILNRSIQSTGSFRNGDYADCTTESDISYMVHSNTPTRPPPLRTSSPFSGHHGRSAHVLVPQVFQRPYRSFSLDNSTNTITFPEGIHRDREQPAAADAIRPFPPRLLPINNNQPTNSSVRAMPYLGADSLTGHPFPARPMRLPPLQGNAAGEMASQHRKRSKRRRGHSWHGEAITTGPGESFAVSPSTMTIVAE